MANEITPAQLNPFGSMNFNLSSVGNIFLIIAIAVVILALVGLLIWLILSKKKWWIRIPLAKKIGNVHTDLGVLKGKVVPMGKAGDSLWFVKGLGIKKFIPPAELQNKPNSYPHYIREDGEWVNYIVEDIDEQQKKANVKYVKTDMRLQRLATDKLLEQRHLKRSFLEKWGVVIGFVIFFLIIAVSLVVFFHQYSKIVDKLDSVAGKVDNILTKATRVDGGGASGSGELVPALLPLLLLGFKRREIFQIKNVNR